jgi:hypothetical protein
MLIRSLRIARSGVLYMSTQLLRIRRSRVQFILARHLAFQRSGAPLIDTESSDSAFRRSSY